MPNLTIYVPRELHDAVKAYRVPVSATCQAGLARKVRLAERRAVATAHATAARIDDGGSLDGTTRPAG